MSPISYLKRGPGAPPGSRSQFDALALEGPLDVASTYQKKHIAVRDGQLCLKGRLPLRDLRNRREPGAEGKMKLNVKELHEEHVPMGIPNRKPDASRLAVFTFSREMPLGRTGPSSASQRRIGSQELFNVLSLERASQAPAARRAKQQQENAKALAEPPQRGPPGASVSTEEWWPKPEVVPRSLAGLGQAEAHWGAPLDPLALARQELASAAERRWWAASPEEQQHFNEWERSTSGGSSGPWSNQQIAQEHGPEGASYWASGREQHQQWDRSTSSGSSGPWH